MLLPLVATSASSTVDVLGRVTAVVHEDGTSSAYAYDMLSRVVSRSGVGLAESWSYDASGRPAAAARGGVALDWAYDAFGRVSAETRDGRGVTATRDADGRLASFSASGIAQSFAYDAAGRLTTVAVPGQADAYVAYDRSGLESWRLARAGGSDVLRTDLHRDAAGRPLEVAATSSSGAQAGLLRTLDPEGAPLTQVDQSGKGWSFSRDLGTRELLGAQEIGGGSASVATGYDLAGLRATHADLLASGAWSTNAAGETSQARGRPVVNDLLGRVTSLDGWNHTYSCDGLLLSSEPASPSEGSRRSVHAYDALGRRVRTTVQAYVGGQWTAFSATERDFLGRLPLGIETSFADGSAKSWRFMRGPDASGTLEGAGGARGVLAVLKDASSWKAVAADTLGNVLALAGVNGDFTRRTFDPWGNPLTRDASGSLRASTLSERRADYEALPLAWASQEVDPDTGLTHYHFREYSPSLGGWLTQDPIGLAGGYLDPRSYLGNRPADALDAWGEAAYYEIRPSSYASITGVNTAQMIQAGAAKLPRFIGPEDQKVESILEDPNAPVRPEDSNRRTAHWKKYILGNVSDEAKVILDKGCSMTVMFHGQYGKAGSFDPERTIKKIIEEIKDKIRKGSSTCKCINSITLVSCFGGTNGNAKAIADATGLPVVTACGDGIIYPLQRNENGPIGFFEDSPNLGQEVQRMDEEKRRQYNKSLAYDKSFPSPEKQYTWGVVRPTMKNTERK